MKDRNKIIIVGGNAAGPAAAAKAKRVNPEADVLLFEASDFISTGTCELPYVLSGEIKDYKDVIFFDAESFKKEKGVDVYVRHFVEEINKKEKYILASNLKDGKVYKFSYDKLILATGSTANRLPIFPPSIKNVFTLKTINDLLAIKGYIEKESVRNVAVFGSGYVGLEAAEAFRNIGCQVLLIEKELMPLPSAEIEVQNLVSEILLKNSVQFYGGINNLKVIESEDKISKLIIDGRDLDIDLILSAVGFLPNNSLAVKSGLEIGNYGGIKTDLKLKTSDQHIFAAGDNIEVKNRITNQFTYLPLATLARDFGYIAGENAAGGNIFYEPVIKNIGVKIFNKFYVSVGISTTEANNLRLKFLTQHAVVPNLVKVMPESESVFGKIVYDPSNKQILGASFFGGKEAAGYGDLAAAMILTKQPASAFASINFNYTPPLSPFLNLLSLIGKKINQR